MDKSSANPVYFFMGFIKGSEAINGPRRDLHELEQDYPHVTLLGNFTLTDENREACLKELTEAVSTLEKISFETSAGKHYFKGAREVAVIRNHPQLKAAHEKLYEIALNYDAEFYTKFQGDKFRPHLAYEHAGSYTIESVNLSVHWGGFSRAVQNVAEIPLLG